jgi:hypothetical protein
MLCLVSMGDEEGAGKGGNVLESNAHEGFPSGIHSCLDGMQWVELTS